MDNRTELPAEESRRNRTGMVEFIKAWQSSNNVDEVAEKLGLKKASVQARASKYRSGVVAEDGETFIIKPIALKRMSRGGGTRLNADEANRLIAELGNGDVSAEVAKLQKAKLERMAKAEKSEAEQTN